MSDPKSQRRPILGQRLGEHLGRYELLRVIGRGGMGDVYKARALGDSGFEKLVVIKLLRAGSARPAELEAALVREAHLGVRLDHEGIAQVLDLGREDDTVFLVMEYVHGFHFGHLLRHAAHVETPLPIWVAAHVARRILDALAYLHELDDVDGTPLGLVHRDVSPSNVLVGVDGRIKLADFGIAKIRALADDSSMANVKGKFAYMPPEALSGKLDASFDLFSLGVILYEAVAGQRPFEGSDARLLLEYETRSPSPPSSFRSEVSAELDELVLRALAPLGSRFGSAREMREALALAVPPSGDERERFAAFVDETFRQASFAEVSGGGLAAIEPSTRSDSVRSVREMLAQPPPAPEAPSVTRVDAPALDTIPAPPPPVPRRVRLRRSALVAAAVLVVAAAALLVVRRAERRDQRSPVAAAPAKPLRLRIGFSPARGVEHARKDGERVSKLVSHADLQISPFLAADYAALVEELVQGRIDLAWLPPLPYVRAAERGARALVLVERNGQVTYRGALVVRRTSPIHGIDQLRGKKVGWVDRNSSGGYVFPRALVAQKTAGSLTGFFASEQLFGSHDGVCRAVLNGWVDVGASYANAAKPGASAGACEDFLGPQAREVRVLALTEPIPGDCIAARPGLDPAQAEVVTRSLLALEQTSAGKQALREVFSAERLVRPEIGAYDHVRRAAQAVEP